jgi:hypothetical protein
MLCAEPKIIKSGFSYNKTEVSTDKGENFLSVLQPEKKNFQQGGEHLAWRYLDSL